MRIFRMTILFLSTFILSYCFFSKKIPKKAFRATYKTSCNIMLLLFPT